MPQQVVPEGLKGPFHNPLVRLLSQSSSMLAAMQFKELWRLHIQKAITSSPCMRCCICSRSCIPQCCRCTSGLVGTGTSRMTACRVGRCSKLVWDGTRRPASHRWASRSSCTPDCMLWMEHFNTCTFIIVNSLTPFPSAHT